MDVVTHAASGALVALALPRRPMVRWCLPFFAACACLPDLDIVLSTSPGLFIALHRGISHSLVLAPLLAFVWALLARPLWRPATKDHLPLGRLWLSFWTCLIIHLWLDCITTFGTRVFLPFSELRVRLNAVFIVDLFLTVPLLTLTLWAWLSERLRRRLAAAGLVWLVLYPCLCMGLNHLNARALEANLSRDGQTVSHTTLLPDFFTPFYWRALYIETMPDGCHVLREQSVSGLGRPRGRAGMYTPLSRSLTAHLSAQSRVCRDFMDMMLLPVVTHLDERGIRAARVALSFLPDVELPPAARDCVISFERNQHEGHPSVDMDAYACGGLKYLVISDLRFGSGLALGRTLLGKRPNANIPFRLMVVLDGEDNVLLERAVFSDIGRDSGWRQPSPPEPQTFCRWLTGMH